MVPWSALYAVFRSPGAACLAIRHDPPPWRRTLLLGCIPVIAVAITLQILMLYVFPPSIPAAGVPSLPAWGIYLFGVSLAGTLAMAWLGTMLAEVFDGRADFDAAMAGVSLVLVPWALARIIAPVPWLGWLAIALVGWGGWVLYQAYGICLRLHGGRLGHLFACVMGTLLIMLAVGWQLRDLIPGAAPAMRMGRLWLI
ncbi:MAG: Yip1 family protein [Aquisalimonadaceae bacterium]